MTATMRDSKERGGSGLRHSVAITFSLPQVPVDVLTISD